MANIVNYSSTYGALLAAFKTTDLDGLTTGSYAFGSDTNAIIDNTTNLRLLMDVLVKLGSINPSGSPYFTLSVLTSIDGTTFEDPSSAAAFTQGTPTYYKGVTTGSSAKVAAVRGIILPPGKSKMLFGNQTGQTLATGGNTITYWTYSYNNNGS